MDLSNLITGCFTLVAALGAVFITNLFHNSRLRTQLDHDRALKDREREMSLRRDIYLAAAEAVSAGLMAVGQFPYLDIPYEQVLQG